MKPIDTPGSPFVDTIPITPLMDTQLDQIVITSILKQLRTQVLRQLEAKISRFEREDWFEIFLVLFILLNSIEIATTHDHEFAAMYGHEVSLSLLCTAAHANLIRPLAGVKDLKITS